MDAEAVVEAGWMAEVMEAWWRRGDGEVMEAWWRRGMGEVMEAWWRRGDREGDGREVWQDR